MSKKRSTRNTNKSLKALKRKQYARGGKSAVQSQRELLGQQQKKTLTTPVQPKAGPKPKKSTPDSLFSDPARVSGGGRGQPKGLGTERQSTGPAPKFIPDPVKADGVDPSLYSDPNLGRATRGGGIDNPRDIKLPEPSRSLGGGRGQPIRNDATINQVQPAVRNQNRAREEKAAQKVYQNTEYKALDDKVNKLRQEITSRPEFVNAQRRLQESQGADKEAMELVQELLNPLRKPSQEAGALGAKLYEQEMQRTSIPSVTQQTMDENTRRRVESGMGSNLGNQQAQSQSLVGGFTNDTDVGGGVPPNEGLPSPQSTTTVTNQGITKEAPIGIKQQAPTANLRQMESVDLDVETGISTDIQELGDATDATSDTVTARELSTSQGDVKVADEGPRTRDAERYTAELAGTLDPTKAAKGDVSKEPVAGGGQEAEATEAKETERDTAAEEAAKGKFVDRPEYEDYATAARDDSDYGFDPSTVDEPKVTISDGVTIPQSKVDEIKLDAEKRGLDPTDALKAYSEAMVERKVQTAEAAVGEAAELGTAPTRTAAKADFLGAADVAAGRKEQIADAGEAGFATREAEQATRVGDMKSAIAAEVQAQKDRRTAVTDDVSAQAEAEQTAKLDAFTLELSREAVTGTAIERQYEDRLGVAPERKAAQAEYFNADFTPEGGNTDIESIPAYEVAATRTAQVAEASTRIASELGDVPSVDLEGREAITGEPPVGNAAQIGGIPTMAAATMQAVTGQDRNVAAADMMEVVANIPENITAAVSQDPAEPKLIQDLDADPTVTAAVAALPQEALVSTQMEGLLAGMEDGQTPAWAKPAVAAIEAQMARRGLSASSVGRDALFNAIIQSALPMAQSNAQALQQRAQQNLSNEQQANLASAQNTMQVRMQNLANRQTAASQTADMAQQIAVQQGTFDQQAVMTSAQQQQEARMATSQMAQQRAQQESAQTQQAAIAQLSTNAQMDLANLQAESTRAGKQLDADQQMRLTKYNAQIAKVMRQADLDQDMEKANLSPALQVEMQRVSEMNAASKDRMTAEQTERLTELQTLIDFRKTDAQFAQQMDMANMSNEQQVNLAMLQEKAATDSANFTAENQFELTRLNNIVSRSTRQAELDQQMEVANLDSSLKIELSELSEKNNTARAEMSAEQQMRLKNLETLVNFKTTNAQLGQQMDMANMGNAQQMEMAMLADKAATDSANFTEANRFKLTQLQTAAQHMAQNTEFRQQTELANLSTEERLQLANLTAQNQASSENLNARQQVELANLNAKLTTGVKTAEMRQQAIAQTFSADQQIELANLEAMNRADAESLSNEQQSKLTTYNATVQRTIRQTELNSRMEEVNLDARLKVELSELSEKNATERANMTTDQQMRLANLNTLVDFKKADAGFAQQMELANLGNEQQMELAMLQEKSAVDAANFTEANRGRTQELNTFVQVMSQNEQLKQNADMANLSMEEKIELANLSSRSQADMASMSAENVQQLQVYEKKMQAGQVNAQLAQQMGLANLSNEQAAGMFNAQMNANLDVAAMSNEQQMELANSKFMQSMTATKFSADQQTALQNATALTQVDLANADARTRVSVENAKNFLTMDMANLSNEQQGIVMDQQLAQQRLLSDQAAKNAALQFGATSQNQMDQFMISQSNSMRQFNTSARNAMESFNVTEANRMEAIEAGNTLQADSLTAQLEADISKFNASIDNQRDQWNAANAQAVEQSNINWRRQANTVDTAAANAANQQNVQNAYNISALDQTQMWQQLRDEAAYIRQAYENNEQREATLIATAIGNESGAGEDAGTTTLSLLNLIKNYSGSSTSSNSGGNRGGGSNSGGGNTGQNDNPQEK